MTSLDVPPALQIRDARREDCAAIAAIYGHAVLHGTASWEVDPPSEMEMVRRQDSIVAAGFPYLVAEQDGVILGYCYANAYRPRPAYRGTVEDSIYLAPAAQGRGTGKALLSALLEICTARGYRQIIGVIGDGHGGSLASLKLHESLGFALIGIAKNVGFKHGRWLDQHLLQRTLGEGCETPLDL